MSTTTIRLSDELKARLARAARHAGATSHAFIIEAIAEKTDAEERRTALQEIASSRNAELLATGECIAWTDMRAFLEARAAGKRVARPNARKLAT